jgi:hypothetical protein
MLSKERLTKLLEAERELANMLLEFDKAEECGIDCQQLRANTAVARQRIESLRKHYTPIGR